MGRLVDLDDITDATGVAEILGLSKRQSVATYRGRYVDFPGPVLDLGQGRCLLWLRSEIEAWHAARRRRRTVHDLDDVVDELGLTQAEIDDAD